VFLARLVARPQRRRLFAEAFDHWIALVPLLAASAPLHDPRRDCAPSLTNLAVTALLHRRNTRPWARLSPPSTSSTPRCGRRHWRLAGTSAWLALAIRPHVAFLISDARLFHRPGARPSGFGQRAEVGGGARPHPHRRRLDLLLAT